MTINDNSQYSIEKYIGKQWYKNVIITVNNMSISALGFSTKGSLLMLDQIHKKLIEMPGILDFKYTANGNIRGFCL